MADVVKEAIDLVTEYFCNKYNMKELTSTKEICKRVKKWRAETRIDDPYILAAATLNSPYDKKLDIKTLEMITLDYFPNYKKEV